MKVFDPLYGESTVQDWMLPLVTSAAVQRLRWIGLSNVASLTYPMIAGISRYAHCLGVSIVAGRLADRLGFDEERKKILMAAGMLHDAGIPPGGHLMEEALKECGIGFDHETSLRLILFDEGRRFFQLPDGTRLGVIEAFARVGIKGDAVMEAIKGRGELGRFICATIDLDNIDNVIRIYHGIFGHKDGYEPVELAINYFAVEAKKESAVSQWECVRLKVYEKLMFSFEDFSQKATIKRLMRAFIKKLRAELEVKELIDKIRFWSDTQLIVAIAQQLLGFEDYASLFAGKYDRLVQYGWATSLSESDILQINGTISEKFDRYYVDFIPDKRFKHSATSAQPRPGALVGLFSFSGGRKSDESASAYFRQLMPSLNVGAIPANSSSNLQLDLV